MAVTHKQRAVYLAAWAIAGLVVTYLLWGWVTDPIGCDGECEAVRRFTSVFVGAFAPIFADIPLKYSKGSGR